MRIDLKARPHKVSTTVLPRDCSRCCRAVSVDPSLWCLSRSCIVSKRLNVILKNNTATSPIRHPTTSSRRLPRHQLSCYGRWAFCVAGLSVWNSLPDNLRNPIIGGNTRNNFRQFLKTFLFETYWCIQRITGFMTMCYINRLFTYLLLLTYTQQVRHHMTACVLQPSSWHYNYTAKMKQLLFTG